MRVVSALLVLTFLGGAMPVQAAKRPQLVAPQITVQEIVALSSTTPQRFRITLLIDNINTDPLPIRTIEFKLRLANEGMIDGRTPGLTIEALDRQTLIVELSSDIVSSLSRLMSFVQGPTNSLPYEIFGRVTLERRMLKELPFGAMGLVPLTTSSP